MIRVFPQYMPSERGAQRHVQSAHGLGLVPLVVAVLLAYAKHWQFTPGLLCSIGVALGVQAILLGCWALSHWKGPLPRVWARAAAIADSWFPHLLFAVQSAFILMTMALLWAAIADLGFPSPGWLHIVVSALIVLTPVYRFSSEAVRRNPERHGLNVMKLAGRFLLIANSTLLVSGALTIMMTGPGIWDHTAMLIILWVIASVIILTSMVMFLGHIFRPRNEEIEASDSEAC